MGHITWPFKERLVLERIVHSVFTDLFDEPIESTEEKSCKYLFQSESQLKARQLSETIFEYID